MGLGRRCGRNRLLAHGLPTVIRSASRFDPAVHGEIERAADELFREYFGELPWDEDADHPAPDHGYAERLLEATSDGEVVGFARLIEAGEFVHLEQLSVRPDRGRRGIGGGLVAAVLAEARECGARAVTLRTFAAVPWNAPFYEDAGFRVVRDAPSDFHESLVRTEEALGLLRRGARVHMLAELVGA